MLALIRYLLITVILITVIKWIVQFVSALFAAPAQSKRTSDPSAPQQLKKDPVCGTFVAPSALQKTKDGHIYYFCSAACRDKFV